MAIYYDSQLVDLVLLGEPTTDQSWLISDWGAGQSSIVQWSPNNVYQTASGGVEFVLSAAPVGSARPYLGGEIQSSAVATTGT